MSQQEAFKSAIEAGYQSKGQSIILGAAMLNGQYIPGAQVQVPLKTMNRHGLIAGATGTGKTKTLQVLAEQLSLNGVPVLLMDLKGDLSGLAKPGTDHPKIQERSAAIGIEYQPQGFPVEILSLSDQEGVRLRATVSEFGPILLSRILDLNETQQGVVAVIFKYCDDHKLPLLDLEDFKKVLQYATGEGKESFQQEYGRLSVSSTGSILRKIIELEQQGAAAFFGERSFEVTDLVRIDDQGRGYLNILRLDDIQDRPKLFSTFMLSLLAEIYNTFPEQGDAEQPELVLFIDEAHLIFNQASRALLEQISTIVKLIRSKGIGIYFITQNPTDVPEEVLAQLGLKIQHALRAFTAKDRKAIKLTAENFPISEFYDTAEVLTALGIGEALVTALDEKGRPTPLATTLMRPPLSRMDILSKEELSALINNSALKNKYNERINRESAYEMLSAKVKEVPDAKPKSSPQRRSSEPSMQKALFKVLTSATFIRGVMGILQKTMK